MLIDDFLTEGLQRWKERKAENEISAGHFYVYVYRNSENRVIQQ